jgi:hypothetical protein
VAAQSELQDVVLSERTSDVLDDAPLLGIELARK